MHATIAAECSPDAQCPDHRWCAERIESKFERYQMADWSNAVYLHLVELGFEGHASASSLKRRIHLQPGISIVGGYAERCVGE